MLFFNTIIYIIMCGEIMKLRIKEHIDENTTLLNEDQWYKVDINPSINICGTSYNDIYVWARNNVGTAGINQVRAIYNDALSGKYRGRGKEQSFNRDVADEISSKSPSITGITPTTVDPINFANVLSRTDRGLRKHAHNCQESNIRNYTGFTNENMLIHHIDKNEGKENLTNLVALFDTHSLNSKDSKTLLDIGHLACHLSQQIHGGVIRPITYQIPTYDFSTTPPTMHTITITI